MTDKLSAEALAACAQMRSTCAAQALRRASRLITQRYDQALAPSGLKVTQLPILVALGMHGPLALTPMAGALALDRTTLTRNLRILEQRGFVTMAADDSDARVRLAAITDEGAQALVDALELWKEIHGAVVEEIGEPRLHALYSELSLLTDAAGV